MCALYGSGHRMAREGIERKAAMRRLFIRDLLGERRLGRERLCLGGGSLIRHSRADGNPETVSGIIGRCGESGVFWIPSFEGMTVVARE